MTRRTATPGPRDERGVLAARILGVARESFAEQGYAGTTVRAVARAADVDPALVYHYYGSKEGLLDAATTPPQSYLDEIVAAWAAPDRLGEQLVRRMLRNWADPAHAPALRAIVQIAGIEPVIREKLRQIVERSHMGPAAQALPEAERLLRSGLVASQMMGLAFMRFIWKVEPLAGMSDDAVVAVIAPTIQRYLDGDLAQNT